MEADLIIGQSTGPAPKPDAHDRHPCSRPRRLPRRLPLRRRHLGLPDRGLTPSAAPAARHWDTFAATPGNVVRAENGAHGLRPLPPLAGGPRPDRSGANLDAYRFSTSWARVMPEGRGAANPEGLDFYDRLVDGMLARGLKPCATLYHWELPSPLADLGGWRNRDIADWFADYTEVLMRRIGDRVWSIATINEPWCVAWLSHFLGHPRARPARHPRRRPRDAPRAAGPRPAIAGDARPWGMTNLGIVLNFEYAAPADDSPEAIAPPARYDGDLQPLVPRRHLPQDLPRGGAGRPRPAHARRLAGRHALIGAPARLAGRQLLHPQAASPPPPARPGRARARSQGPLPKTQMGWEIYPEGLQHFLTPHGTRLCRRPADLRHRKRHGQRRRA